MNDDEASLYSELQIAKDDLKAKRHRKKNDSIKYVILTLYLIFFASTAFANDCVHKEFHCVHNEVDSVHMAALAKKKGFWGWTCEYCRSYNPPAVSTCQTCRKPRGY